MSQPSIGRVVHYHPVPTMDPAQSPALAAIITRVWSDSLINVAVFDLNGNPVPNPPTSVPLLQTGEPQPQSGPYCVWPAHR